MKVGFRVEGSGFDETLVAFALEVWGFCRASHLGFRGPVTYRFELSYGRKLPRGPVSTIARSAQ